MELNVGEKTNMQNSKSAKPVVEAGILSVIIVVLMIINDTLPFLGTISMFILPIPMTVLALRHDVKTAIVALVASTVLGAMLIGPITAISTLFLYGPVGITLGFCVKRGLRAVESIQLTFIGAVVGVLIQNIMYGYLILGSNLKGVFRQLYDTIITSFTMNKEMYSSLGVNLEDYPDLQSLFDFTFEEFMVIIIPVVFASAMFIAFLNYVISRSILRKLSIEMKPLPHFSCWYIDSRYLAGLIIIACLGIILEGNGIIVGEYLYVTAFYFLQFALITIGLSAVSFFLMNKLHL